MTVSVISNGVETSLDDGTLCKLIAHDGWGMAPQHRLSSRGGEQHGETDLGYRLDPRFGSLVLLLPTSNLPDMYDARDELISLFAPDNNPVLKWVTGGRTRYFDCHYYDDMSMPWDAKDWAAQKVAVTLKCPYPACYDPSGQSLTFNLGGGSNTFAVPTPVPTHVGASTIDSSVGFDYAGNWLSYPQVRITGPITSPVVTNNTTGEKLDFTGITISAGHYYDIDCRFGYKTVKLDGATNKVSELTTDSDLATFHIAKGANSIRVTGSSVTSATKVELSWFEWYLGK